jgi:carboxypeptidase Q
MSRLIFLAPLVLAGAGIALAAGEAATAARYRPTSDRLIDAALKDDAGLQRLEYLCYRIGNRLSGSDALNRALDWSATEMKGAGLKNVGRVPVKVPHWVRGAESAEMLEPMRRKIFMLGLGGSPSTPPAGIEADIVAVSDFEELRRLGRPGVQGRIVLFDAPFVSYDETVKYRDEGPARAQALGAVAALVRSITPRSLRVPHTGATAYGAPPPKIPCAAVAVEDAMWMHGLVRSGQRVRVRLSMQAHFETDADSADVMGEIPGRERKNEVVVIGGHIDSWDVGMGAHDDGAGVMAALEAAALIEQLGLHARRTIRVVFWTNEENGGKGGKAYRDWADRQPDMRHIAAIEMDGGAERPIGFDLSIIRRLPRPRPKMLAGDFGSLQIDMFPKAAAIASLLSRIHANQLLPGSGESDIEPLMAEGVPGFGLRTAMTHYWDYHHSEADTFDKIVPDAFRRCVAAMAVMSYVLADWP